MLSAVSPAKQVLYGVLAANANTSFTAGQSTSDIARSLNGVVNLNLQNGKIAHLDLLNELASIGKFAQSGKQSEPFTNVAKLTGDFKITNGQARTDNLKAVIDGGTLAANGLVNLADQSLNMQMTAVLSKDYSQSVGGTGIGGYLNTALANAKGELVMPVLITGTFSNPHIAPDVQRLAQMKLENLLPSSSNPGALTTGILGGILGNKGGNAGGSNQQQKGGLQGILGQLSGQGQENQNQQNQQTPKQQNLPANDNTPNSGAAPAQAPQKQANPLDQLLNAVTGQQKKKKASPQQQKAEPPPPPPPPQGQ
jgi:hypothetical protein